MPTNTPVALRGETLRAKSHPTVTELLTRHALEIPTNNVGAYDLSACCQMAEYLARWDVQGALPVAQTLSKRASTVMKYSGQQLGNFVIQLSLARARAGDPTAFDDYAEWIVTTTPGQFEQSNLECLVPFRKFPTNAMLQAAAEKLFSQTNSLRAVCHGRITSDAARLNPSLSPCLPTGCCSAMIWKGPMPVERSRWSAPATSDIILLT
jgi:hypothetical protein